MRSYHDSILGGLTLLLPLAAWPGFPSASLLKEGLLVLAVTVLLVVGLWKLSERVPRRPTPLAVWGLLAFVIWASASWLSTNRCEAGQAPLIRLWALLLLFLLVFRSPRRDAGPWKKFLLVAAGSVALLALGEWFGLRPFDLPGRSWAPRSRATFSHPNFCGTFLALTLPWILGRMDRARNRGPVLVLLGLVLAAIASTLSRGAYAVALVTIATWMLLGQRRVSLGDVARALAIPLLGGLLFLGGLLLLSPDAAQEYLLRQAAIHNRVRQWQGAWKALPRAPFLGSGWGRFAEVHARETPDALVDLPLHHGVRTMHGHNEYLETAVELGLVGLLLFSLPILLLLRPLATKGEGEADEDRRCARAAVVGLLVSALGSVSLRHPTALFLLWLHLGFLARGFVQGRDDAGEVPLRPTWLPRAAAVLTALLSLTFLFGFWRRIDAETLILRAEEAYDMGALDGGLVWSLRALGRDPSLPQAAYLEAYGLFALGRLEEAQQRYEDLARRWPAFGDVDHHLGLCLLRRGRPRKALPLLRTAVRRRPWDRGFTRDLVEALVASAKFEEALAPARAQASASDSTFVDHSLLGRVLLGRKEYEESLTELRRALDEAPADLPTLWSAFEAARASGETDGALVFAHRALMASPLDGVEGERSRRIEALAVTPSKGSLIPAAFRADLLGRVRLVRGELASAAAAFRAAVDFAPASPDPWLGLADCALLMGKLEESRDLLERCLKRHPNHLGLWTRILRLARKMNATETLKRVERWHRSWESPLPIGKSLGRRIRILGLTPQMDGEGRMKVEIDVEVLAPLQGRLRLDLQIRAGEALLSTVPLAPEIRHGRAGFRYRLVATLKIPEGRNRDLPWVGLLAWERSPGRASWRQWGPDSKPQAPMLRLCPLASLGRVAGKGR